MNAARATSMDGTGSMGSNNCIGDATLILAIILKKKTRSAGSDGAATGNRSEASLPGSDVEKMWNCMSGV